MEVAILFGLVIIFLFAGVPIAICLGLSSIIFMLDLVELMRRASSKKQATLDIIAQMALLKVPLMAQEILPL